MTTPTSHEPAVPDRVPVLELRLPVDVDEPPFGYDDSDGHLAIDLALAGGGYTTLVLPAAGARMWAGALFGAVTVAHREAIGDSHAMTDDELASLPDPNAYSPGPASTSSPTTTGRPGSGSTSSSTSKAKPSPPGTCGPPSSAA